MRGKHVMLGFIIYGLGVTFNGIFFMIIKDWRIVLFLYLFIPFVFMMCGLLFFIEETPFDSWMDGWIQSLTIHRRNL
jgi:cyanate permease